MYTIDDTMRKNEEVSARAGATGAAVPGSRQHEGTLTLCVLGGREQCIPSMTRWSQLSVAETYDSLPKSFPVSPGTTRSCAARGSHDTAHREGRRATSLTQE